MKDYGPQMRRQLLGSLSEEEREELAERLLIDDQVFEAAIAEEQRLLDEFVAGSLSAVDEAAFREQCRIRPELSERAMIGGVLKALAAPPAGNATGLLPNSAHHRKKTFLWALVAAMLALTIGTSLYLGSLLQNERRMALHREQYWAGRDRDQRQEIGSLASQLKERQTATVAQRQSNDAQREAYWEKMNSEQRRQIEELNSRLAAAESKPQTQGDHQPRLLSMLILPETRGPSAAKALSVPSKSTQINLYFIVDNPEGYSSFSVKLSSAGRPVLDQYRLHSQELNGRWIVPVVVTTEQLGPGEYDATLFGVKDGRELPLFDYRFELTHSE
jgi:hypothetical protein